MHILLFETISLVFCALRWQDNKWFELSKLDLWLINERRHQRQLVRRFLLVLYCYNLEYKWCVHHWTRTVSLIGRLKHLIVRNFFATVTLMTKSRWMDGEHTPMGNWQCTTRFLVAEAVCPSLLHWKSASLLPAGEGAFPNRAITRIDVTHWVLHLQRIAKARLRLNLQLPWKLQGARQSSTGDLKQLIICCLWFIVLHLGCLPVD